MKKAALRPDKFLVLLLALFIVGGGAIFTSAAFGTLGRGADTISSVMLNHLVLGIGLGLVSLIIALSVPLTLLRRFAPHLFVLTLIATALCFVPHVGMCLKGGCRWIHVGSFSLQPSEALKIASILAAAAYFAGMQRQMRTIQYGVGGFFGVLAIPALLLVMQPDIGTLGVVSVSVCAVYFAAGARWRDLGLVVIVAILALGAVVIAKPYVRQRIMTFIHPAQGQQSEGYQIRQSLIAIGSGGITGRGLGQGVQKFTYLPEPMGDSIFAVAGEELGFIGTVTIVIMFTLFAVRGFAIAAATTDIFASLVVVGISTYLVSEAFINMGSMLGLVPLTGIPLTFISHGGTAMLFSLLSAGILLNASKYRRM